MTPLEIGGLTLFILVLLFGAFSVLFGLPGTVIILIDVAAYATITGFERIGFKILVTLLILSILAELADFAVGMAGAVTFGVSRKAFGAAARELCGSTRKDSASSASSTILCIPATTMTPWRKDPIGFSTRSRRMAERPFPRRDKSFKKATRRSVG